MWPVPGMSDDCLVFSLDPAMVSLAHFSITDKKIPYILRSYRRVPFEQNEYADAMLFNPTRLARLIKDFLPETKSHKRKTIIGIKGPIVKEKIVSLSSPMLACELNEFSSPSLIWDYRFLYEQNYQQSVYYFCGIAREHLFQFQLFALGHAYDLIAITTPMVGYCALYQKKEGANFSVQRFGDAMMTQKNQIHQLITINDLAVLMRVDNSVLFESSEDVERIAQLFGLLVAGE